MMNLTSLESATAEDAGRSNVSGDGMPIRSGSEADAVPLRAIETLQQRWDAASQAAVRRRWSVTPSDSRRCRDRVGEASGEVDVEVGADVAGGGPAADRGRAAATFLRRFSRHRRALPDARDAASMGTGTVSPHGLPGPQLPHVPDVPYVPLDEVVVAAVPPRWEVRRQYTLAEILRGLSSCAAPFTHASQLADDLFAVSTHPGYTPSQRLSIRSAAIVADQLTGLAPQVFLLQSVCKLFRILADLIEAKSITPGDILDINMLSRHLMVLKRIDAPLYNNPKFAPPRQRQPPGGIARKPATPPRAAGPAADVGGPEGHYAAVLFGAPAEGDVGPAMTTLEMFYSEAAGTEGEAANNDLVAGRGHDEAENARSSEARAVPPEPEPEPEASPEEGEAERAAIRRIAAEIVPATVQWTRVKSVPLRRRADLPKQWEAFPLSAYRVRGIDVGGRASGERFSQNGRDYLHLDGTAVAVRDLLPGEPWIVDNRSYGGAGSDAQRLPAVPLWKTSAGWTVQEADLVDVSDAHGMPVSDDGYIRLGRRKFIQIDGLCVETSRQGIDDESTLLPLAQHPPDALPGADTMQIIWAPEGRLWIEGEHGYYRLHFDLAQQAFYVIGEARADGELAAPRVPVDFDVQRHRWAAVVETHDSDYAEMLALQHLRLRESAPAEDETFFDRAGPSGLQPPALTSTFERSADIAPEGAVPDGARVAPQAEIEEHDDADMPIDADAPVDARATRFPLPVYDPQDSPLEREFALFGHYARYIKKFPFLSPERVGPGISRRRKLRRGLREALFGLEEESMVPVNRMDRRVRLRFTHQVLRFRQRLRGLYPPMAKWRSMTLQEKQYEVGLMVDLAYRKAGPDMWPCLVGYCHEIADVMLNALTVSRQKLRENLLQLSLVEQTGVKGTHVLLVYADDAETLNVFGDLALRDVRFQRSRPVLNEEAFYGWLLTHRESVLLIDAWSTNKLIDLSEARTAEAVRDQLRPNLFEAGFETTPNLSRFQVRAVLPERPEPAQRWRRDPHRTPTQHGAPATWEVLGEWAVTGVLPEGVSLLALGADLSAAANAPALAPERRTMLATFAAEMREGARNTTSGAGVDRRRLIMAGHAALALRDSFDVALQDDAIAGGDSAGATDDAAVTTSFDWPDRDGVTASATAVTANATAVVPRP